LQKHQHPEINRWWYQWWC